jgi:phage tail-like protein
MDIDADECDILYILDTKSMSILTYHRNFKNLRMPSYKPGILAHLVEDPKGIAVDEYMVYIIGTFRTHEMLRREGLVALNKKDLRVIWSILKGPDGIPLEGLTDLGKNSAGDLFILEKGRHRILKLPFSCRERSFSEIGRKELYRPENIYSDADGMVYVFDEKFGYFKIGNDGALKESEIKPSTSELIRRRRTHDSKKNMYLISEDRKRLRFIEYIEENSPDPEGIFKGTYFSKHVDSHIYKNQWYRFVIEGNIPKGTMVEFSYYISDKLLDENNLKERHESKWEKGLCGSSAIQGEEIRDALFWTESEGQYLWFKLALVGTENLSPVISSITLYFPKVSYLEYLPSVYREDYLNRDFLDRFLAIFESLFFDIDFTIEHLSSWLDAKGTPPEFLEWLGSWVGVSQERGKIEGKKKSQETKQRKFISRAVSMYRDRGTRKGLENLIFFYTGKKPVIIENLPVYCTKGNTKDEDLNGDQVKRSESQKENSDLKYEVQKGNYNQEDVNQKKNKNPMQKKLLFFPSENAVVKFSDRKDTSKPEAPLREILFGKENFSFFVLFEEKLEEEELELIQNIIEEEKPAYTTYKVKVLEPWFYLDGHTYLEINTKLKRPEFLLEKSSVLGRDTALGVKNMYDISGDCQETGIMLIQSDQATSCKDYDYFNRRFGHGRLRRR